MHFRNSVDGKKAREKYLIAMAILVITVSVTSNPAGSLIVIDSFNNSLSSITLNFPEQYTSKEYFITMPDGTVSEASMRLEGRDLLGQTIVPADIVLITDVSGSMDDNCPGGSANPGETPCKINDAKTASLSFLSNVNLNYIHVGLVSYSSWGLTRLDQTLTDDRDVLETTISLYSASGYTNMGGGMELALDELLSARSQGEENLYMIVLTDGIANCYPANMDLELGMDGNGVCGGSTANAAAYARYVANKSRDAGVVIFGVGFGSDANMELIRNVSLTTGGSWYFAPDSDSLTEIYNEIAQTISYQDFPTPEISSKDPQNIEGWSAESPFSSDAVWKNGDCGAALAGCIDYRSLVQSNIDSCLAFPCDIVFSVYSSTFGTLNLSELYIEINEPPFVNLPPTGQCAEAMITCPDTDFVLDLDDGQLADDPNDGAAALSWVVDDVLSGDGQSYFSYNTDFNSLRLLNFSVPPDILSSPFWNLFDFRISDPWGEEVSACINVSFSGCGFCIDNGTIEMSDRAFTFNISFYPGYEYYLSNMIDSVDGLPCKIDSIEWSADDPDEFNISGPDGPGNITIAPAQGWQSPASGSLGASAYCEVPACYIGSSSELFGSGNADVVLITDFSGSMKKAINSWDMGYTSNDCDKIYDSTSPRKTHLAKCVDQELVSVVLGNDGNRVWPVFLHDNEVDYYGGDPTDAGAVNSYISGYGPQGTDKTCIACALNRAYQIFEENSDPSRLKFVVLMTDGVPTHCAGDGCTGITDVYGPQQCEGFCDTNGMSGCGDLEGCDDALCEPGEDNTIFSAGRLIGDFSAKIYTIAFGIVQDCERSQALLGQIAQDSGAEYHHSYNTQEIRQIYLNIAQDITSYSDLSEIWPGPLAVFKGSADLAITYEYEPVCGNLIREGLPGDLGYEECDDGNLDTDDQCSNSCRLTYCGDNIVQQPNGEGTGGPTDDGHEQCDLGINSDPADGCNDDCTFSSVCPNGIIELEEECDDDNDIDTDSCVNCHDASCGDGFVWTDCSGGAPGCPEECDLGSGVNRNEPNICRPGCTDPVCGDGVADNLPPYSEECDDGNTVDGDGCSQDCQYETICGDGIREGAEMCDDGFLNSDIIPNRCRSNCQLPWCGDDIIDDGYDEECDSGMENGLDECSVTCKIPDDVLGFCGDWTTDADLGEKCDDGPSGSDSCTPWCEPRECLDGIRQSFENCDDGNTDPSDFCDNDCEPCCKEVSHSTFYGLPFEPLDLYPYVKEVFPPPETDLETEEPYFILEYGYPDSQTAQNYMGLEPYIVDNVLSIESPSSGDYYPGGSFSQALLQIDYLNAENPTSLCINLEVEVIPGYGFSEEPETWLLVAKEKQVQNYYETELSGETTYWGPYLITVKVWEK